MTEYFNTDSTFIGNPGKGIHDVILQGLDQSLNYAGQQVNYPVEPFKASQGAWDGVPAVYVPSGKHIPTAAFNSNPKEALAAYGGKIVGQFQNSKVITAGKARLQSQAHISDDGIEAAIMEGKIRVSSAFNAAGTDAIQSPIIPSYVLLFDKDVASPRDKSSMFLNTDSSEETDMSDEVKISELKRDLRDEKATVERLNTESIDRDAKIVELTGTVERLNSEATETKTENESIKAQWSEFMNTKADRDWNSLKATIAPGLVAKPEDEKALRELMNTDVLAFTQKIMSVERPAETKREGSEYLNSSGNNDAKYADLMISEVE